ncbi:hypothetical protein [Flavobacterium sp.]|uniref:hypothetical protein n=1 Tax=Flavobacterium sp. TaxID=239 RepID=UPI00375389B0
MKKTFQLEIKSPCQEKFIDMKPNSDGSYCNSCAKNVIDFITKSNSEISKYISENKNKNICARLKTSQLEQFYEYGETSKINNFKYAVAVAASVLLTSNVVAQEKNPVKTEVGCAKPNPHTMGKIAYTQTQNKVISFSIQGKVLDGKTKKPVSEKSYPNLYIFINGTSKTVKINPKTGRYELSVLLYDNTKEVYVRISNDDFNFSKSYSVDLNQIKNGVLPLNIIVNPNEEFKNYMILGGLGVNYKNNKNQISS